MTASEDLTLRRKIWEIYDLMDAGSPWLREAYEDLLDWNVRRLLDPDRLTPPVVVRLQPSIDVAAFLSVSRNQVARAKRGLL